LKTFIIPLSLPVCISGEWIHTDYMKIIEGYKDHVVSIGDRFLAAQLGKIKEVGVNSVDELVTESDLNISQALLNLVREKYPLSLTEESLKLEPEKSAEDRMTPGSRWIIDPVDGTLELKARNAELKGEIVPYKGCSTKGGSGMILGLVDEFSRPVAMIGYVPETRMLVWSTLDEGPYVAIDGILQKRASPNDDIVAVQRTVARLRGLQDFYEFLAEKEKRDLVVLEGGGPGAMAPRIVTEGINLYIDNLISNWKEWDTVGLDVLARRIGGHISDLEGRALSYNLDNFYRSKGMLMALSPLSGHKVLNALREFEERYSTKLLVPDKHNGVSLYDHYRECMANPAHYV
jgi:fructose-1,6-bisphosphatase/inositol monophosphatase family enzyme